MLKRLCADLDPITDCADRIEKAIDENAPLTLREGGLLKKAPTPRRTGSGT